MSLETWKDIPGYKDRYQASNRGRIRSKGFRVSKRTKYGTVVAQNYPGKILKQHRDNGAGIFRIAIRLDGKPCRIPVGPLVLMAFLGPSPHGKACIYLNGDKFDNRLENLAWAPRQ